MRFLIWLAAVVLVVGTTRFVARAQNFDKLSDADRAVFQERFSKEIYPIMMRGGKDGCVGCHSGKIVSSLKLSGDAGKDFKMLLAEGFFIPGDSGSVLGRVSDKNPKLRMPPPPRAMWEDKDVAVLKTFVAELDKKQKK